MLTSNLITPNAEVPSGASTLIRIGWLVIAALAWTILKPTVFPGVITIAQAIPTLWLGDDFGPALRGSFGTNITALLISALLALPISYLSRVPAVRPFAMAVSQLRFLSPAIFFLVLLFLLKDGGKVKVAMLVLGETFFLATTMINAVQGIPTEAFDEARVLRMNEWKATYYVVVRGTLHTALEAIRDNAAIGWSMLMMVEGIIRSQGGLGVLMLNQERYMRFDIIWAIAASVLIVGIAQDWALKELRGAVCPHTKL
jgi:NitT/TauT family transport system permease protein